MRPLTDHQSAVLAFVRSYIETHGKAPTLAEIADRFDIAGNVSAVRKCLERIVRKGHITIEKHARRGIRLGGTVHKSEPVVTAPPIRSRSPWLVIGDPPVGLYRPIGEVA